MREPIEEFLKCKSMAIIGASRGGRKFGNRALTELTKRGYRVIAIHPSAADISGVPCYPNLASAQGIVDGVVVSVHPQDSMQVLRDAAAIGLKRIWLQQGAESAEVMELARSLNLDPVTNRCILMYAAPVGGFHAWHRGFFRLLGKL
ncbi:MAG TPA: CoA-binding protein [Bacteroidota bacterium]|nr:CoA-binding protein [Bacteroidota bacterium]